MGGFGDSGSDGERSGEPTVNNSDSDRVGCASPTVAVFCVSVLLVWCLLCFVWGVSFLSFAVALSNFGDSGRGVCEPPSQSFDVVFVVVRSSPVGAWFGLWPCE
ncbi:hypothetical protein LWI29_029041 [Acer saccharum]|uniref:Transmembrane protein n=1 Tax=Acer saccharum TaxID=4024 RepID=A0AA39S0M6_ACESA|nr:hypothetical protein LWI29_029041 [Acer saccharum]